MARLNGRIGVWGWSRRVAAGGLIIGVGLLGGCQAGADYVNGAQALAALAAEPLDTTPWEFSHAPGVLITTEHYKVYTTVRDPLYQRLLAKLLEATYRRAVAAQPAGHAIGPMECYVFGDRAQWELYTRLRAGSNAPVYLQISAGGYCQEGVFAGYDIGREQTLSVIAHEAWHQYSWYTFKDRLPSWLEEGLATQNEAIEWNGVSPEFRPELNYRRYSALKQAMREGRIRKISELTNTHAGREIKGSERTVGGYYAQLWSLTMFLQHSKYRVGLQRMLDDAQSGKLSECLAGTGVSKAEIAGFTERWNVVAGPMYLKKYISADPGFEGEYQAFLKDFTSTWPPKVGD